MTLRGGIGMSMIFKKLTQTILEIQAQEHDLFFVQSKWNELKALLELYDANDENKSYYFVVAEEILSRGGSHVPEWLSIALRCNSSALLRLYLSHHQFEEAADLTLYLLTHNVESKQVWLPYVQIDQLLCSSNEDEVSWGEKLVAIRELVSQHVDKLGYCFYSDNGTSEIQNYENEDSDELDPFDF
jgi:hypothetical protein